MAFHFKFSKRNFKVQDVISPLFRSNSNLKHSLYAEMHQEHNEIGLALEWCLDSSNFSKIQGPFFPSRRIVFKEVKRGVTVR